MIKYWEKFILFNPIWLHLGKDKIYDEAYIIVPVIFIHPGGVVYSATVASNTMDLSAGSWGIKSFLKDKRAESRIIHMIHDAVREGVSSRGKVSGHGQIIQVSKNLTTHPFMQSPPLSAWPAEALHRCL